MRCCHVQVTGNDNLKHGLTVTAISLFHAAQQAVDAYSMFWWWVPDGEIVVRADDAEWIVKAEALRRWKLGR